MALPALAGISKGLMGATKGLMGGGAKQGGKAMASKMLKGGSEEHKDNGNSIGEGPKVSIIKRPAINFDKFVNKTKIQEVEVDVDDPKVEPLEQALKGLTAIAYSMQDTVDDRLKLEKKKEKYRQERKLRLERLRRGFGVGIGLVKGAVGVVNKATGGVLDKIQRFFTMILIGALVTWIVKNYEKFVKKFKEIRDKLIEWKETYFDPFMEALNKYLLEPMQKVFTFVAGPLVEMMAKFVGVPDYEAEKNTITQNLDKIVEKTPLIGDAYKGLKDLIDGFTKQLGIGNVTGDAPSSGRSGGGGSGMVGGGAATFDVIASGEGDYNSVNQGVAGDTPGGAKSVVGKDLTDMTVGEVMAAQASGQLFAVGKYQIIPKTMKEFVSGAGIDPDAKFDATTQEKFKDYVINIKRPEVGRYLRGESDDVEAAAQGLAREFASVGLARPEAGRGVNESRYSGTGGNRASISTEEIQSALKRDREAGSVPKLVSPNTPPSQRSSYNAPGSGSGAIVEYLTGDRSSSGYRADHGGDNYHEHIAFNSTDERDAAMALLQSNGITIGSINTGKHAPGSYHYVDQAFDVPLYPNIQNLGIPDTRAGEEKFSKMVRDILAGGGFTGSGVGTSGASITPPSERKTQKQIQSVSQEPTYSGSQQVAYMVTPAVSHKVSGGGGGPTSNKGSSTSLNRKQQYDYMKFLYKG